MADGETTDTSASRTHVDSEKAEKKKRKRHKHKHHHRHRRRTTIVTFDFPGVVHVAMNDEVQKLLHCVVGEGVTAEKPWKKISRDPILEQIEMDDIIPDFIPFLAYKQEIIDFPGDDMLIGYIPDESRDFDDFYLCVTTAAEETVGIMIKRIEEEQQARLHNAINKVVRDWTSLGSEVEVDENIPSASRGFIKVELETNYPIMIPEVTFHYRLVNDVKDGYVELKVPARYAVPNINRRRIHCATQVAPSVRTIDAQTDYPFPKNTWTQYLYECTYETITKENKHIYIRFFDEIMDPLSDRLFMNAHVNLFSDDYAKLISKSHAPRQKNFAIECMSFKDIKKCKDKMISAIAWHPMWTGIVAIAYANVSPLWINTVKTSTDILSESVHGQNPVLIWSFDDSLSPKLLLETNSEVHCLAFCPQDENLLIGGCINGQVVLWDIKNKLNKVEEIEILTTAQHKYRTLMFSMMKWMKNTKNVSIVPFTAISGLTYSHLSNVTSIAWVHPLYEISKTGQFQEIEECPSLQFISSSSDGSVKIWDLKQKPIILPGDYKPQRKSKRLKVRPPALTTDVSPFRILNRKLLPHYQINVILPKADKTSPLTFVRVPTRDILYEEVNPDPDREYEVTDRIFFRPIFHYEEEIDILKCQFIAGTYMGEFTAGTWEGFEYSSGEVVSNELPKIVSVGRYHDGPILCVAPHPGISDLFLSVGGKVFAIWNDQLKNRPVFWRRSKQRYTHGDWRKYNPCSFSLSRADGNREIWNLQFKSDSFYYETAYSGKALFEGIIHPFKLTDSTVLGLADWQGSLRVINISEEYVDYKENLDILKDIISTSAERRKGFEAWQNHWVEKYATWIMEQREEARLEAQRKKEEEDAARLYEEEMKAQEASEAAKKTAFKLKAPPGHYEEWAHEQYICREQERMGNVLLAKKRLDRETLVRQQAPLKKLEAELEKKRLRQKARLQKADLIFNETIKMLFPDLVEAKEQVEKPQISDTEATVLKQQYFDGYNEIKENLDENIEDNPYIYKFNWRETVAASKKKKKMNDFQHQQSHKVRYERERKELLFQTTSSKIQTSRKSVGFVKSRMSSFDSDQSATVAVESMVLK